MIKLYVTFASIMSMNNLQVRTQYLCVVSFSTNDTVVHDNTHV